MGSRGLAIVDGLLRLWTRQTLLIVAIVFVVQAIRGPLGRNIPELAFFLGVAPNFLTAALLPFAIETENPPLTFSEHARRCVIVGVGLCGYEAAQGAGLVPAHKVFDLYDVAATIVGVLIALGVGWMSSRWAKVSPPSEAVHDA
jgi:hypothetical protein